MTAGAARPRCCGCRRGPGVAIVPYSVAPRPRLHLALRSRPGRGGRPALQARPTGRRPGRPAAGGPIRCYTETSTAAPTRSVGSSETITCASGRRARPARHPTRRHGAPTATRDAGRGLRLDDVRSPRRRVHRPTARSPTFGGHSSPIRIGDPCSTVSGHRRPTWCAYRRRARRQRASARTGGVLLQRRRRRVERVAPAHVSATVTGPGRPPGRPASTASRRDHPSAGVRRTTITSGRAESRGRQGTSELAPGAHGRRRPSPTGARGPAPGPLVRVVSARRSPAPSRWLRSTLGVLGAAARRRSWAGPRLVCEPRPRRAVPGLTPGPGEDPGRRPGAHRSSWCRPGRTTVAVQFPRRPAMQPGSSARSSTSTPTSSTSPHHRRPRRARPPPDRPRRPRRLQGRRLGAHPHRAAGHCGRAGALRAARRRDLLWRRPHRALAAEEPLQAHAGCRGATHVRRGRPARVVPPQPGAAAVGLGRVRRVSMLAGSVLFAFFGAGPLSRSTRTPGSRSTRPGCSWPAGWSRVC